MAGERDVQQLTMMPRSCLYDSAQHWMIVWTVRAKIRDLYLLSWKVWKLRTSILNMSTRLYSYPTDRASEDARRPAFSKSQAYSLPNLATWQQAHLVVCPLSCTHYALPTFWICLSTFPLPNEDYDWTPAGILKSPERNIVLIGLVNWDKVILLIVPC